MNLLKNLYFLLMKLCSGLLYAFLECKFMHEMSNALVFACAFYLDVVHNDFWKNLMSVWTVCLQREQMQDSIFSKLRLQLQFVLRAIYSARV